MPLVFSLILLSASPGHHHHASSIVAASIKARGATPWTNAKSTLFQGTNDTVDFGDNLGVNLSATEWTISAWIRPTSLATQTYIFSKSDPFGDGSINWILGITTDGKLFGYYGDVSKTTQSASTVISINTWYHVALTVRNVGGTYTANIWLNAAKQGSDVTSPGSSTSTGKVARFGSGYVLDSPDTLYPMTGYIDEVTIWSAGFTAANVTAIYNSNVPANPLSHAQAPYLIHYYRMGDTGDTYPTIQDRVGSVHGTCTNMAGAATNFTTTIP